MNLRRDTEEYILYGSAFMKEKSNYGDRNQKSGCWWSQIRKGHEGIFLGDGKVLFLGRFVVTNVVYMDIYVRLIDLYSADLYHFM